MEKSLAYVVASNSKYRDVTCPLITKSLLDAGIAPDDIYIFVGQSKNVSDYHYTSTEKLFSENLEQSSRTTEYGVECYEFSYKTHQFMPLIAVVNGWWSPAKEYTDVFNLHDTCLCNLGFKERSLEFNPETDATSVVQDGLCDLGRFSIKYLKSQKTWLDNLLTCDQNYRAQHTERWLFQNAPHKDWYPGHEFFIQEPAKPRYPNGVPRVRETYLDGLLEKVKQNWFSKPTYGEDL